MTTGDVLCWEPGGNAFVPTISLARIEAERDH
jgi:hypothetical protein